MHIAVFGSGLVGSLYALLMTKLGHSVEIYEKRPNPSKFVSSNARSINLALSARGKSALELAGILDKVMLLGIPMQGRMVHQIGQEAILQAYSQYGYSILSISRHALNELLIAEAEQTGLCTFVYKAQLLQCTNPSDMPLVQLEDGTQIQPKADLYIGADGTNSVCRSYIQGCRYSVDKISHNYKEIEFPALPSGKHAIYTHALHIWPRGEYMFIGLPNLDGSFTGTLFLPKIGDNSFDQLRSPENVNQFFKTKFPDTYALIPDLLTQFFDNPTSNLGTVWAEDWYDHSKKIGIIGDAAHGIVPFYGQGMNSGFEDCRLLFELLKTHDFDSHFEHFASNRKPDTDAIAHLSMQNFIEMRDLVAQESFILQKKIESKIQAQYPKNWMPLYSMVSFSTIPYREVYARSLVQQAIMDQILELPAIQTKFEQEGLYPELLTILYQHKVLH